MRRFRWLPVAALLAILASVGATYFRLRDEAAKGAPEPPKPLEAGLEGRFGDWCYTQNDGDKPKLKVCAKKQRQIKEPSVWELEEVELQVFRDDAKVFDLVKSAKAEFDVAEKTMFSDGAVEITRGVPAEGPPPVGRLVQIHTSGVRYASGTGKATTDRAASFQFDKGSGSSVGLEYDPATGELFLRDKVVLDWKGKQPVGVPMHIEAGQAVYLEHESRVALRKWSKLTRGTLHMDAGDTTVTLEQDAIRLVETVAAKGVQDDPGRKIEFAADELTMRFADGMNVEAIQGRNHARLASTSATARTTVTGNRLDLAFTPSGHESILTAATSAGSSVAESAPLPGPEPADTRTLRSDVIRLSMRTGGQEIDRIETDGPGTLDFTPNRAGQPKRHLDGDRISIAYGAQNRIQSFHSTNVTTRTERPNLPVATTRSKEFVATFDPATSQLARIEQEINFQYQEGERQARGDRAVLDQVNNAMTLDGGARVWDPSGSANADHIELDQRTGDYRAEGRVATARQPDKKGSSSAMLSNQDVMQARAQRLMSSNRGQKLHYEGSAVAWQGANRIEADQIDFDRERRTMEARGKVVSQLVDKAAPGGTGKTAAPAFTVVRAASLDYAEASRLAYYRDNVVLTRPGLTVNSKELQAFLSPAGQESSLEKAIADGAVKIVSQTQDAKGKRIRTGTGEHAEYFAADQKLVIEGGDPQLVDSAKGKTTGRQLTWFANSDRLLVDGEEAKPAVSTIRKK